MFDLGPWKESDQSQSFSGIVTQLLEILKSMFSGYQIQIYYRKEISHDGHWDAKCVAYVDFLDNLEISQYNVSNATDKGTWVDISEYSLNNMFKIQ